MPHKCIRCGAVHEMKEGGLLDGCPSCGGKKFIFISAREVAKEIQENREIPEKPKPAEPETVHDAGKQTETNPDETEHERIECIRILGPGTYELNIEKMASSDERVVGLQDEGTYVVDLFSMTKKKKKMP